MLVVDSERDHYFIAAMSTMVILSVRPGLHAMW